MPCTERGLMPDVLRPVVDVLFSPPLILLREFPQGPPDLVGTGNLPAIAAPNRPSYGGVFIATTIPIGLSRTANLRPIWSRSLLNLNFIGLTFGPSPPLPIGYEEMHVQYWVVRWFSPSLASIEYDVLPGVSIQYSYLRLG